MSIGNEKVKDCRVLIKSAMSSDFVSGNHADWNRDGTDVFKLAMLDPNLGGLTGDGIENPRVKNYLNEQMPPIPGLCQGNIQFGMYTGNGSADDTTPFEATFLSKILGAAVVVPEYKTYSAEADSTTTQVNIAENSILVGDGVLINGEVRRVASRDTDSITLSMALTAAPSEDDTVVVAHKVAGHSAATPAGYFDFLVTLASGQEMNILNCMGGFGIEGLGMGDVPKFTFDMACGLWRWEGSTDGGTADSFDAASAFSDNNAVGSRSFGTLVLGDADATTIGKVKMANVTFTPGVAFQPVPDQNSPGGIGDYARTEQAGFFEADIILGLTGTDMPGLVDDWRAGTKKQWLVATGKAQQSCFGLAGVGYIMDCPTLTMVNGMEAVHVKISASDEGSYGYPYYYWF